MVLGSDASQIDVENTLEYAGLVARAVRWSHGVYGSIVVVIASFGLWLVDDRILWMGSLLPAGHHIGVLGCPVIECHRPSVRDGAREAPTPAAPSPFVGNAGCYVTIAPCLIESPPELDI